MIWKIEKKKKFGNLEIKKAKIFKVVFDSEKYRKKKKSVRKMISFFIFSIIIENTKDS